MPKVLRIINRFNLGGPTYNATFLTKFLSDDFETILIGGLPEEGESDSLHILQEYGIEPLIIEEMQRIPNIQSDAKAYKRIKKIIEEFKPDIVHTHAAKAGALGRRAAIACKVPVIVHTYHGHVFHSYFGKVKTSIYKHIEKRLANKSTGIVAISDLQKKELSEEHKIAKSDKIKVIPLGFDLGKFQENIEQKRKNTRLKYNLKNNEVAIAIIGRLAPIKDHAFFLNVVENLLQKGIENAKFFVVGDGEISEEVCQRIDQINEKFPNKIIFTSWIKEIDAFNPGMDIICLTSKNEGTPVSLIEAQACNVPVVTTDVGGVRDIILEGETGFIIPKGNLEHFSEKLGLLIKNDEIRKKMSVRGWGFVKEKFHYTRLVKDMENYYKDLLQNVKK
jgi:glycosyltransferase involved in cell wall biosynthesis